VYVPASSKQQAARQVIIHTCSPQTVTVHQHNSVNRASSSYRRQAHAQPSPSLQIALHSHINVHHQHSSPPSPLQPETKPVRLPPQRNSGISNLPPKKETTGRSEQGTRNWERRVSPPRPYLTDDSTSLSAPVPTLTQPTRAAAMSRSIPGNCRYRYSTGRPRRYSPSPEKGTEGEAQKTTKPRCRWETDFKTQV